MKNLILIGFLVSFASCKQVACCVPPPDLSEFNGEWELVRVVNGYGQIDRTGKDIGYSEILVIDAELKTFTRYRDSIKMETSSLVQREEAGKEALVLVDEQVYHWYSFEEWKGTDCLVLYAECPLGVQLADGSHYYFSKK